MVEIISVGRRNMTKKCLQLILGFKSIFLIYYLFRLNTYSKNFYVDNSVIKNEPALNDANDVLHVLPDKITYAVIRPGMVNNIFLVNLLNKFGERGGFD